MTANDAPARPPLCEAPRSTERPSTPTVHLRAPLARAAGAGRDLFVALEQRLDGRPAALRLLGTVRAAAAAVRRGSGVTPEPPEISEARRIAAVSPEPGGKKVLVMSFRGWTTHVAFEYLIGHALRLHGAHASYVVCGGGLPTCELGRPRDTFPEPCRECRAYALRMLAAGGFASSTLDDLVSDAERVEIARQVQSLSSPAQHAAAGLELEPLVRKSVLWLLRSGLAGRDLAGRRELAEFVESGAITATAFDRLLERERPDAIVMASGLFFAEAIMLALARERSIRVVTYDFPGRPGTVFVSGARESSYYDIDALWEARGRRPPTAEERHRVIAEIESRAAGNAGDLWQSFEFAPAAVARHDDGRTRIAVFTNVSWDLAVAMRDHGFADMFAWLDTIVEWARARDDVAVDIRIHPGETKVRGFETRDAVGAYLRDRHPDLPAHVTLHDPDSPVSSYALIEQADAVLVHASTIGLEAALLGKPVLVSADVHYRGKGFTRDVEGPEHLVTLLDSARTLRLTPEEHDLAITYAHLFFFEAMIPIPSLGERWRGKPFFRVTDARELVHDPGLKAICNLALEEAA